MITVYSNIEDNRDDEADQIELDNHSLRHLVQREYRDLGDAFEFDFVNIYFFDDRFVFIPAMNEGYVHINTHDLFHDYLDVSHHYQDINQLFSIGLTLTATEVVMIFYLNENRDGINRESFRVSTRDADGYYKVEAANLYITNIDVTVPQSHREDHDDSTLVIYSGYVNIDNGRGVETPDTFGMNHRVPIV